MRQSSSDKVTLVGAGITLMHAMQAADTLAKAGINVRVVDPFTVKPIDRVTLLECAKATGGRVITVEDHYPEGRHPLSGRVHAVMTSNVFFLSTLEL